MAMSDNLVRNKMLEVERERLEVERKKLNIEIQKTKVLMDIRDVMLMMNGMMGLEVETNAKAEKYNKADQEMLADDLANIKKRIEKRWAE